MKAILKLIFFVGFIVLVYQCTEANKRQPFKWINRTIEVEKISGTLDTIVVRIPDDARIYISDYDGKYTLVYDKDAIGNGGKILRKGIIDFRILK